MGVYLTKGRIRRAGVALTSLMLATTVTHAQSADTTVGRRSSAAATGCDGGFMKRALCKAATAAYHAGLEAGMYKGPGVGDIEPPKQPLFGTYRMTIVRDGKDSLTYFLRTQALLYDRVQNGPWTEYLGRFSTAMTEAELPATIADAPAIRLERFGEGAFMVLLTDEDSLRFGIRLTVSPPPAHPLVREALSWLSDALTAVPPVESWPKRERAKSLIGSMSRDTMPTRFNLAWVHEKRQFLVRAERISETMVAVTRNP
jgi:hypothetical protein